LTGINARGAAFAAVVPQCDIGSHVAKALTDVNQPAAFGASIGGRPKKQHPVGL